MAKRVIYEPSGRAGEYAGLAANCYRGCAHGCFFCFAPQALRKKREVFHGQPEPRKDVLRHLEKDGRRFRGDDREILVSFTTDPYQPLEMELGITRRTIEILIENGLSFTILTKGGLRATRDFDLLASYDRCRFGSTIVFTKQSDADRWEQNAPSIADRMTAIREAHARGIWTWVSLEPVIDPDQALALIEVLHPIVDHWKVGKLNYMKPDRPVDWIGFRRVVTSILDSLGADYYIKKSLTELQ